MFGIRILFFLVAYVVVIAEMVVGAKAPDKIIWILPGGLVLTLLLAMSYFVLAPTQEQGAPRTGSPVQWVVLVLAGMAIAAVSFFLPETILPFLVANT